MEEEVVAESNRSSSYDLSMIVSRRSRQGLHDIRCAGACVFNAICAPRHETLLHITLLEVSKVSPRDASVGSALRSGFRFHDMVNRLTMLCLTLNVAEMWFPYLGGRRDKYTPRRCF